MGADDNTFDFLNVQDAVTLSKIKKPNGVTALTMGDDITVGDNIIMNNGSNIQTGTSTGSSFASAASQKISFHGATPIVQQTGVAVTAAGIHAALVNLGLITA